MTVDLHICECLTSAGFPSQRDRSSLIQRRASPPSGLNGFVLTPDLMPFQSGQTKRAHPVLVNVILVRLLPSVPSLRDLLDVLVAPVAGTVPARYTHGLLAIVAAVDSVNAQQQQQQQRCCYTRNSELDRQVVG